jgi:hypothetical protein
MFKKPQQFSVDVTAAVYRILLREIIEFFNCKRNSNRKLLVVFLNKKSKVPNSNFTTTNLRL